MFFTKLFMTVNFVRMMKDRPMIIILFLAALVVEPSSRGVCGWRHSRQQCWDWVAASFSLLAAYFSGSGPLPCDSTALMWKRRGVAWRVYRAISI